MNIRWLTDSLEFPLVDSAAENGMLAFGGDLSPERLMLAYKSGIFPWYNEGEPIVWYSPDPRMVLFPNKLIVSKSMRQWMKKTTFTITYNKYFEKVIDKCKMIQRDGQDGTWITEEMKLAYLELNKRGVAKSVEVWNGEELVGGLYGLDLGDVFCGESMFATSSNASKLAFISLVRKLEKSRYKIIDCQVYTNHLASLGAVEIPRSEFLKYLCDDFETK